MGLMFKIDKQFHQTLSYITFNFYFIKNVIIIQEQKKILKS